MSAPLGQLMVPSSASSCTRAKYSGSLSGSKTPLHSQSEASSSPPTPSSNASRRRCAPTTSTSTIRCRCADRSTRTMLRKGIDAHQRRVLTRPRPIESEFVAVQLTPLLNQPQSSGRTAARDALAGLDRDDDRLARVRRVEVRHPVLAVVHRDDDPVELADPRHGPIVAGRADARRTAKPTPGLEPGTPSLRVCAGGIRLYAIWLQSRVCAVRNVRDVQPCAWRVVSALVSARPASTSSMKSTARTLGWM